MAMNSVKFRIEGDGTSALKALNDVKRGMNDVRDVVSKEITSKIKQAFSVAAIAEMTRRTAEWADNLTQAAKKLQVTTTELQGFQLAGSRIGMDSGKIEGLFGTMEDAAYEALKGNTALLVSFGKLGIQMDDLRKKKPAQLFETIMGKMGTTDGFQGVQEIFGRGEAVDIQRLSATLGGKSGEKYANDSGMAISESDVGEITASWRAVIENLKELGAQLAPFVKIILALVDGVIKMVTGVIGTITGVFGDIGTALGKASTGDFGGAAKDFLKITGGRLMGVGGGIAKFGTLGLANQSIDDYLKPGYDMLGTPQSVRKLSEGGGEGLGNTLAFGVGPLVRGLGLGAKGVSSAAGVMGMESLAGRTAGIAGKLGKFGGGFAKEGLVGTGLNKVFQKVLAGRLEKDFLRTADAIEKELGIQVSGVSDSKALMGLVEERITSGAVKSFQIANLLKNTGMLADIASVGGVGQGDIANMMSQLSKSSAPFGGRNPMMQLGAFGTGGGSGGGNLNIGGVFGSDVSFKIMSLNQEMAMTLARMLAIMESNRNPATYQTPIGLH